jgi:hypothetical protein
VLASGPFLERFAKEVSMRHPLRWVATVVLAAAVLAPAAASAGKANVKITNRSDWDIHHFYISSTDDENWGPDQLGDDILASGGTFTLQAVPCDEYDVKLVDEDGDVCVIGGVDICGQHQAWTITSDDLIDCERASAN